MTSPKRGDSKPAHPDPVPSTVRIVVEYDAVLPSWKPKFPFLFAIAEVVAPASEKPDAVNERARASSSAAFTPGRCSSAPARAVSWWNERISG